MNAVGQRIYYATTEEWTRFLAPIAAAVKNPPGRTELLARAAACADALAIRSAWLTDVRRRDAMARYDFWPSVHEIGEVFDADKRHAMSMASGRDTTGQLPKPEPRGPLPLSQVLANAAKVAELKAEVAETERGERPKVEPSYLKPHQLLAAYERLAAEGNAAAAMRAKTIRAQMETGQ